MLFHFIFSGIPTLVLLDENYKVITEKARAQVIRDPEGKVRMLKKKN